MVLSTLIGVAWSAFGAPMPGPVGAYLHILADALTACALVRDRARPLDRRAQGPFRSRGGADRSSSS